MRTIVRLLPFLLLASCTTLTDTHNTCMQSHKTFAGQVDCIKAETGQSRFQRTDPLTQEYLLTADLLKKRVQSGTMDEAEARLRLTEKLNQIRERDIRQQADEAAVFDSMRRRGPTFTDCNHNGGSVRCVTY